MVATRGWEPEPTLADALAGSGGMADPIEPTFASSLIADVFPDALSAAPLPWITSAVGPDAPVSTLAQQPAAARPASAGRTVTAPTGRQYSTTAARQAPAPTTRQGQSGAGVLPAPPIGKRPTLQAASARPWSQFPPPGAPATQYVPAPTSAQLAPGTARRPTTAAGYPAATPRPIGPSAPINPVRPPAYLPQNQGLAQVRSAIAQARQSARRSPGRPAGRKKASGAWGFLIVLLIVLVSSGLGQRIIDGISQLLQRR